MNESKRKQRGYLEGFGQMMAMLAVAIFIIGIASGFALPWLWSVLKPLLHGWTA